MNPQRLKSLLIRCGVEQIIDRGTNYQALCPYHNERNPSWGINKSDPHLFGCFTCHAKGSIVKLLVDKLDVSYTKAAQLAETQLATAPEKEIQLTVTKDDKEHLYEVEEMMSLLVPSPVAYRYLMKRGINLTVARKADIRFDYAEDRVVFPWYVGGACVGATGRSLQQDARAKTIPYGAMPKGDYLYFPAPPVQRRPLVLVEGEIDALKTWQALVHYAKLRVNVAALGFGVFTEKQQALAIKTAPPYVQTMLDYDKTGAALSLQVDQALGRKNVRVSRTDWASAQRRFKLPEDEKLDPAFVSDEVIQYLHSRPQSSLYV
jgi:DNA primase